MLHSSMDFRSLAAEWAPPPNPHASSSLFYHFQPFGVHNGTSFKVQPLQRVLVPVSLFLARASSPSLYIAIYIYYIWSKPQRCTASCTPSPPQLCKTRVTTRQVYKGDPKSQIHPECKQHAVAFRGLLYNSVYNTVTKDFWTKMSVVQKKNLSKQHNMFL